MTTEWKDVLPEDTTFEDMGRAVGGVAKTGMSSDEIASAITASARVSNGMVIFGDSLIYMNKYVVSDVSYNWSCRGFFTTANFMLDWAFKMLNNAGVSGDNTEKMLLRIQADVLDYSPEYTLIFGGVNDFIQDLEVSVAVANMTIMLETLDEAGIVPICFTVPITGGMATETKPQEFNAWLAAYCREHDIVLVDVASIYADVDNDVAPYIVADLTVDGVHPGRYGGYLIGSELADKLRPFAKPKASWVSRIDCASNVFTNSLNRGQGGNVEAGVAPDGMSWWKNPNDDATFTGSLINRGSYYDYVITLENTGTERTYCAPSTGSTSEDTTGGLYVLSSEFGVADGVNVKIAQLTATISLDGTIIDKSTILSRDSEHVSPSYEVSGTYVSDVLTIPAGVLSVSLKWELEAETGVMTIGRHQLIKVGELS